MPKKQQYKIKNEVFLWGHDALAPWHFVAIPQKESARIKEEYGAISRGWQSLPVQVTVNKSIWKTSIFFDSRSKTYLLPLKATIRKKEGIYKGEVILCTIQILP